MQGYTWPPGNFFTDIDVQLPLFTGKIAKEMFGGNAAKFVTWIEQGAYASFYRAGPTLQESQSAPQRRGWHRKFSWWCSGFGDGHAEFRYMDTRVVHGNNWTVWDPKKPRGGLP